MKKEMNKKRVIIIAMYILGIIGIIFLSYNYIISKINLTFETVNLELYGNNTPEEINKEPKINNNNSNLSYNSIDKVQNLYTYIGYLNIPKINLNQGLVDINSKENNVDKNIQIIKPSDYPDITNGNLILASHSGSSSISYFKHLYQLVVGDTVNVNYKGYKYTYQIVNIYNTPKNGTVPIYRNTQKTTITLITCTKNSNTLQTVYIGELINKEVLTWLR